MRVWFAGALGAALMTAAGPAAAKVMTLSYYGSVDAGADNLGVFGGGTDLASQAFVASFVFDTDFVGRSTSALQDRIEGGSDSSLPSFLSASLEINGLSYDFPGGVVETVVITDDLITTISADGPIVAPPDLLQILAPGANQISIGLFSTINIFDLERNDSWDASSSLGHFQISSFDGGSGDFIRTYGTLISTRATLDDGTGTSAAPEPATWAMMILGFGAAGAALRRRRGALTPA